MNDDDRPQRLDHYELVELIGEGGAGRVYRARDTRLDRMVAVKLLDPRRVDQRSQARFGREARLAASLNHPNIVAVHDCSPPGAERCYLVTELVSGGTLRQKVGPVLLAEEAALLLLPVARALAAAHGAGIVHRDVKPDNILVDQGAEGPLIKLADFGIALATFEPRITTDDAISGSVAYLAPEQLLGRPASPASDVWSFGVTLFELVHGRLPFEATSIGHLVSCVLEQEPEIDAALLSPALAELLRSCLRGDPSERPADGAELAARLQAALASAGLSHPDEELRRWDGTAERSAAIGRRVADHLVSVARDAPSVQQVAELLDRALALIPDHAEALRLLGDAPQRSTQRASAPRAAATLATDTSVQRPRRARSVAILLLCVLAATALGVALLGRRSDDDTRRAARAPEPPQVLDGGGAAAAAAEADASLPDASALRDGRRSATSSRIERRPGPRAARPPAPVVVHLTTEPWAEVLVGGRSLGFTPKVSTVRLRPTQREILLRNPHCRPVRLKIPARPGKVLVRHVRLQVLPARIELTAPAGWRIELDGRPIGRAPIETLRVAHGDHMLRLVGPAGQQHQRRITAVAGRVVRIDLGNAR